jgi:hypothetical protein
LTYGVTGGELLFCSDDGSAALGGVEGALASYDCLSCGTAAAGLAANLGDTIPVFRHCELLVMNEERRKRYGPSFFLGRKDVVWWEERLFGLGNRKFVL